MRILVWNINSLLPTIPNFRLKHGSVEGFFKEYQADVICFQETKLLGEEKLTKEVALVPGFESFWAFSRERKGYSGVAIYVADAFSPLDARADCLGEEDGDSDIDREGRMLLVDLGAFVLVNVYVPNAGPRGAGTARRDLKTRFLRALKRKCDGLADAGREVIIVGDLNVAASQQDVHSKYSYDKMYSPEEKALLGALLRDYRDTWRASHPDESTAFTVWDEKTSARVFNEGVRIDYALVSAGLLGRVASCEILGGLPPKWSDHAPLLLELADIPAVPLHPPCALSSKRMKRFQEPKSSIVSLFAARQRSSSAAAAAAGAAAAAVAAVDAQGDRGGSSGAAAGQRTDGPEKEQQGTDARDDQAEHCSTATLTAGEGAPAGTAGGDKPCREEEAAAPRNKQEGATPGTSAQAAAGAAAEAAVDEPEKCRGAIQAAAVPRQTGVRGRKRKEPDKPGAKQQSIRSFFRAPS